MFESARLPQNMDKKTFKKLEPQLREALLAAQLPVVEKQPFSTMILVDGLDGAGKGEAVARLYGWMDARHLVCNAYGELMDEARLRPPLWRYWRDLPPKGETAIVFRELVSDRSAGLDLQENRRGRVRQGPDPDPPV